jgi:hypothetical protein
MVIDDVAANSALLMDRGTPLGNSLSPNVVQGSQRRRLHVFIDNGSGEPIPVAFSVAGTPVFMDSPANSTVPGSYVTLIDVFVPVGKTRYLTTLLLTCRVEGEFQVLSGASVILSGRTGPASPTFSFGWNPSRPITTGTEIKVQFKAVVGTPIRDVEAYLIATDV